VSVGDVDTYLAGLQQGADLQRRAVTSGTQQCRNRALQEYSAWLAEHVKCRNVATCIPEDFIVYLTTHWAPRHAGCDADGTRIAAPVSVNALISHLAIELDKLGRVGPWLPSTQQGKMRPSRDTRAALVNSTNMLSPHAGNPMRN
jgi:hypothetical protein